MTDRERGEKFGVLVLLLSVLRYSTTEEERKKIMSDLDVYLSLELPDHEVAPEFVDGMKQTILKFKELN